MLKTNSHGHAIGLSESAAKSHDIVVAVGGDGTCNEVINGIMNSEHKNVSFGIIPNDTGNGFMRSLKDQSKNKLVRNIVDGKVSNIDLALVHFDERSRYFLNVADIGFGAKVVEAMDRQRTKGMGGKMSYSLAILRTFFTYKKKDMTIMGDGISFSGKSLMLVFTNGGVFGHGLTIHQEARVDIGKLGLTILGNVSLMQYVKNLSKLKRGLKIDHPEVQYYHFDELSVQTSKEVYLETDGEIAGSNTIKVQVLPGVLQCVN